MKKYNKVEINEKKLEEVMDVAEMINCSVLAFVVGTKPCFNKIYGTIKAYSELGIPFFIINANQHYDEELVYMMKEFGLEKFVLVNFHIRGDLIAKTQELIAKTQEFATYTKEKWPDVTITPVVLGDTILCPTVSSAWMLTTGEKSIHLEAGMRSMRPMILDSCNSEISLDDFVHKQQFGDWEMARDEPYPEQWCTFTASASCEYFFVPTELNKEHLIQEGYKKNKIYVTGAMVSDAIDHMKDKKKEGSIFDTFSKLKEGSWVRIDIHRRENSTPKRMLIILEAIEKLAKTGININLVLLNTFKNALTEGNVINRVADLARMDNVLVTDIWESYADVYEFYTSDHFLCAITDSGGVQEDMAILGKPCITIRNSTDRPETVMFWGSNVLVPPEDPDFMVRMITSILADESVLSMMSVKDETYGKNTGLNIANILQSITLPIN